MTKEQVFPLYLSNPKQQVVWKGVTLRLIGVSVPLCETESEAGIGEVYISDCQLILKRISGMSEGERKLWNGQKFFYHYHDKANYLCDTAESVLWLIKNGYAISDELFENGIAVEQAEEKK